MNEQSTIEKSSRPQLRNLLVVLAMIVILVVGGYFRWIGIDWDEEQHLHPDERFMTMVTASVQLVSSPGEYFNTSQSTMNPHNIGYGFYVYGTLPLFLVRIAGEIVQKTGYGEVYLVGRALSGAADLLVILLTFFIARRLFKKPWLAVLAAAFYACAVLPIQLSHYWTVDTFTNLFAYLAFYFAVRVMTRMLPESQADEDVIANSWRILAHRWEGFLSFALFGIALGMSAASKVSSAPIAILLPAAALVWFFKLPVERRTGWILVLLRNLALAAVIALLVFRICQPYAFKGPGFFGMMPNQLWIDNLKSLAGMSGGDVDYPPGLQWARRPLTFGFNNLVRFGLGYPLGILAFAGFLWMGYRIIRGEWKSLAVIFGWTFIYFVYQSLNFTSSMRYFMQIYPSLVILAAWTVFDVWSFAGSKIKKESWSRFLKISSVAAGIGVLVAVGLWAFSFTRIYSRPVTRIEASRWIYQNMPGAINLKVDQTDGTTYTQPVAFRSGYTLYGNQAHMRMQFKLDSAGVVMGLNLGHILNYSPTQNAVSLVAMIRDADAPDKIITSGLLADIFTGTESDPRGNSYTVIFTLPIGLQKDHTYYLDISTLEEEAVLGLSGILSFDVDGPDGFRSYYLPDPVDAIQPGTEFRVSGLRMKASGTLGKITLNRVVDWEGTGGEKELEIAIYASNNSSQPLSTGVIRSTFAAGDDLRGQSYTVELSPALTVEKDQEYALALRFSDGSTGALALYGTRPALESSWDDSIPYGVDGYSPFDYTTGIYRSDLNFEMYWDDNTEKKERFISIMDRADAIYITSNRQWGTTTRVPERYPMTTEYYRNLIGCPVDKDILWCYSVAEPGMFEGKLGFTLVKTSQSDPNLGNWKFNTQFAEEAFTVYDAPKVFIFVKTSEYSSEAVRTILDQVDLTKVVHLTPGEASKYGGVFGKKLPAYHAYSSDRNPETGGTWSELFDTDSLLNQHPIVGAVVWYVVLSILGLIMLPLVRVVFSGLTDKGYPLARLSGMLLLALLVWLAGSAGIAFNRMTISIAFGIILLINGLLAYLQRAQIKEEFRQNWKQILLVEAVGLGFFILFLLVRLGNPDLWHPGKGGEKPMDFSYFNAVLKSTTFPPYDPWFAGGYINYYYYGFVLVGVPVKWLGIVPSIAYNLILPTMFSLFALGAYCIGYNLVLLPGDERGKLRVSPFFAGLSAAVGTLVIGNLGSLRMIFQGIARLAAPGGTLDHSNIFSRFLWFFGGLGKLLFEKATLPYGLGDWYWIPSRVYPEEPITEFPAFTFLYADPHAHLFALPVTLLALAWALSILRGKWQWDGLGASRKWLHAILQLGMGAVIIGSFRPMNTWDLPTYLAIACLALLYTGLRYGVRWANYQQQRIEFLLDIAKVLGALLFLAGLAFVLYQPFANWYVQGYNQIEPWKGSHSPLGSYLTHWGLFLFVIATWLFWETRDWMAKTPLSNAPWLRQSMTPVLSGVLIVFVILIVGAIMGIQIIWIAIPLGIWTALLLFRRDQSDEKRLILFLIGTALVLTIAVEVIVLKGDIGRMNTVFKFYLQAWTLLGLSATAALFWLIRDVPDNWLSTVRIPWQIFLALLIGSAMLFPVLGGSAKIRDRMSSSSPTTLDGMAYMAVSTYSDQGKDMDLSQDYQAIRWMQENIQGTPVIVEGNTPEYRWGSRFTIYTGLPGVVGWNWHQRQQRGAVSTIEVEDRVKEITTFYNSVDQQQVRTFLQTYSVRYIIVGQLEQAYYNPEGLAKFEDWNGALWQEVYRDRDTVIYEVKK